MATAPDTSIAATWFDGKTAAAHPVRVDVIGRALALHDAGGAHMRSVPLERTRLSEPSARAPRFVYLDDGSTLEIDDAEPFNRALDALGMRPSLPARLQRSAVAATGALAILLVALVFGYTQGVPLLARWIAFALPPSVEARLGEQFERSLDLQMLKASGLSEDHQTRLRSMLQEAAARGAPGVQYVLKSRATRQGAGINAFALPGGTIVLLDGLVEAAADENQVLAVLAHELGHVANKHGMRNVLQAFGIGAIAHATWGDFAGAAANVPVVFGALRYSREFEREADEYAVAFLRANGMDAQPLIQFFEAMAERKDHSGEGVADFLSTHPPTKERIERLKRM
ncbi:MAG TPA: M48 family metallopeptidase [Burkholderiaceae bacterium]|nr:M48 family metallopeptidase [Burkholderiaceae bacterium]